MMHASKNFSGPLPASLTIIGWDDEWEHIFSSFKGPYQPGRVVSVHKTRYDVIIPGEMITVPISGALKNLKQYPVVGDFVAVLDQPESAVRMIVSILKRRTTLSRGGAGESSGEQILVANIDYAFIITDPDSDFSIPRLERYLLLISASGAEPVIILNKADPGNDVQSLINKIITELGSLPVIPVSALHQTGLDDVIQFLRPGTTAVCLGSSGVGKSTLINALSGSKDQKTGAIREDDGKGRHTTTVRHLCMIPGGAVIIDTPGLREVRIWTAGDHLDKIYEDIHEIAQNCRFSDCTHQNEPGCAIRDALQNGTLSEERFSRYQKLEKEIAFEADKADIGLKRFEKKKFMGISKMAKEYNEKKKWMTHRNQHEHL